MSKKNNSNKQRKVGRNSTYCKYYKATHRREKNKLIRVQKHVILHPNDKVALETVKVLKHYV